MMQQYYKAILLSLLLILGVGSSFAATGLVDSTGQPSPNSPESLLNLPPKPGLKDWFFSLETNGSYGIAFRNFEVLQTGIGDLLANRQASEEVKNYFALGINLNLHHVEGLFFKAGINYQQINEQFKVDLTANETEIIPDGIIEIIINAPGDTTFIRGESAVERNFRIRQQNNNQIQFWNIPLMMGYAFTDRRVAIEVEAGVALNVYLNSNGVIIGQDGLPTEQSSTLKSSAGLGLIGGLGINYFLTDDWAIRLNGSFQINPGSITLETYPLEQRYTLLGLNLGLRYYW